MALITDYLTRFGDRPAISTCRRSTPTRRDRREAYIATMQRRGLEPIFVPLDTLA